MSRILPVLQRSTSLAFDTSLIVAILVTLGSAVSTAASSPVGASPAASSEGGRSEQPEAGEVEPSTGFTDFLAECDRLVSDGRLIEARTRLAFALGLPALGEQQRAELRRRLEAIHQVTFFSPRIVRGDPFTDRYVVEPGDTLARIAARLDLGIDWRLLRRVNHLADGGLVQAFQAIKIVRGPFHARVSRLGFRLDLYAGEPEQADRWLFVRSFPVGIGEEGATPAGVFVVRYGGKVTDPFWTDPRTGDWYAPGAVDNPIGDRWIGLEGVGESAALTGFGLHGTIDAASIGATRSMGCVRLLPEDVHLLFELLTEGVSRVVIEP